MCLYVKTKEPSIAEKDIVCYKVLEYSPYFKKYLTPFRDFSMEIGQTVHCKGPWVFDKEAFIEDVFHPELGAGGFHTYKHKADAENLAVELTNSAMVIECIIPKGTEYFCGKCDYFAVGYASKTLKLVKEVAYYGAAETECIDE